MGTKKYLKELENKLASLSKAKREDIINEIKSYIEEENIDYDKLISKFGTVESLANSYLEDIPFEDRVVKKVWYKQKRYIFLIFLVILSLPLIIVYFMMQDPFDYASYNAKTVKNQVKTKWINLKSVPNFKMVQSHVVIYFTNNTDTKYSCKNNKILNLKEDVLDFFQRNCIILAPIALKNIKAAQSSIVIVKPQQNLNFDLEQASLSIAEKQGAYTYIIDKKQSQTSELVSKASKYTLSLKLYQSNVEYYNY